MKTEMETWARQPLKEGTGFGGKVPKKILRKICFILLNIIFLSNTASEIFFKAYADAKRPRYFMLQKGKRNVHDMYNFSTFRVLKFVSNE